MERSYTVDDSLSNFVFIFSAPSLTPHLVTAYTFSSTSLVVQWSLLLEEDFQGQPIGYRIFYSEEAEDDKKAVYLNYTTNIATLTNLTVYTMYVINVSAVSSGGLGPGKTAKARTGAEGKKLLQLAFGAAACGKNTCNRIEITRRPLLPILYLYEAHIGQFPESDFGGTQGLFCSSTTAFYWKVSSDLLTCC